MKKIFTILAFALACLSVNAQIAPNPDIPNDPVEYSRLRLPTEEPAIPAFFTLIFNKNHEHDRVMAYLDQSEWGDTDAFSEYWMTILGSIIHTREITPEFVEECIQRALRTSGIGTREELAGLYAATPEFKDFTYTDQQFAMDMLTLFSAGWGFVSPGGALAGAIVGTAANATGVIVSEHNGLGDEYDSILGYAGASASELSLSQEIGLLNEASFDSNAIQSAADDAFHISNIGNVISCVQVAKLMYDQNQRDQQKWANREHLLNMRRIDYFYNLVNAYLKFFSVDNDTVWVLAFPQIDQTMPFQYGNEMCEANWHLSLGALRLVPLENFGTYQFEGHYFGYLNADVSYDLSKYDAKFVRNTTYEELLGVKGDRGNIGLNMFDNGIDTSYDIGGNMNFHRAAGDVITGVINAGSKIHVKYSSPIHIKVEVPTGGNKSKVIETYADYFWDYYENKYTEKELHWSSLMDAMGVEVGNRDAKTAYDVSIHKAYTATNLLTDSVIREEEQVDNGKAVFKYSDGKKKDETELPIKEFLDHMGVPTTIPGGVANILWTAEIQPAPDNAKKITEDQWRDWFIKYDLNPTLK